MTDIIETIELDAKHRLAIIQDDSPDCPRDWQEGISVHPVNVGSNYIAPAAGTDSHGDALDAIFEHHLSESWHGGYVWDWELEPLVAKHFARANLGYIVTELESGTYIWYWEPEAIAAERKLNPDYTGQEYLDGAVGEYKAWAAGDVYGVVLQKLVTWRREDGETGLFDGGPTRKSWEDVEAIWGNYLEDFDEARRVAKDHFGHLLPEGVAA